MTRYFIRSLAVLLLVVSILLWVPFPVQAADLRSGQDVSVPAGETVNGDLYIAGNTVTIAGTVNGDVFAAGRTVTVSGTVNGGLSAAGQTVDVGSNITGGIRLAGQTVTFRGTSGRDLVVAGSDIIIQNGAKIGADLVATGGTVRVDGSVNGNVKGSVNQMTVNGPVGGNIETSVNTLDLAPAADIKGNVTYTSQNDAKVEPGAKVGGTTSRNAPQQPEPSGGFQFSSILFAIGGSLMALLTGIILILLMENRIAVIADAIGYSILGSLGWGALILFLTPLVILAIFITIIGIPVSLILLALYLIALYISQIFVGLFIGRLILGQYERSASRLALIGALALGLLILNVLMLIPYIGAVVSLATAIFGLGALFVAARTPGEQILSGY